MNKFGFRLETVLNLKTQLEDNAKNNLARSTIELQKQNDYLEELNSVNSDSMDSLNSEVDKGIPVYRLKTYNNYLSYLKNKIRKQKENVNIAQRDVDIHREGLVKAMQERKIIEKLKEKKYQEYLKEQNKADQLLIDELTSFKFNNTSGEENARDN